MSLPRARVAWLGVAALTLLAAACTSDGVGPEGDRAVKIVFFEDLSVDGSLLNVVPGFQGLKLAIDRAVAAGRLPPGSEVVARDTEGDLENAAEDAAEAAEDSEVVAALFAPFLSQQRAIWPVLRDAGIPVVSLSAVESPSDGASREWIRLVPDLQTQAGVLARFVRNTTDHPCVERGEAPGSSALVGSLQASDGRPVTVLDAVSEEQSEEDLASLARRVERTGCDALVWTGPSQGAVLVRILLNEAGLSDVLLVGTDAMKDHAYLADAGPAGFGTVVSCACVDVTTSTDPAAQRFVHDYQFEFGSVPGVYSVEAWDAGQMLLEILQGDSPTRGSVSAALGRLEGFEGLAGRYSFGPDGTLSPRSAAVRLYRDMGGRWIELTPPGVAGSAIVASLTRRVER